MRIHRTENAMRNYYNYAFSRTTRALIFAGPHECVRRAYATVNLAKFDDTFSSFFKLYRVMKKFVEPAYNTEIMQLQCETNSRND